MDHSDARLSHTCPACGLGVRIDAPDLREIRHQNTFSAERKERGRRATIIRAQVPWELLCDECKEWWSELTRKLSLTPIRRAADES